VQSNSRNVQVLGAEKKSAWTDLDRVSFKKIFKESNVEIEKSAWTGLGKVKKKRASSAASVFKNFFTTGHLGVAKAFCTLMA
jgi:carbamoylphosphate synthase large subunit